MKTKLLLAAIGLGTGAQATCWAPDGWWQADCVVCDSPSPSGTACPAYGSTPCYDTKDGCCGDDMTTCSDNEGGPPPSGDTTTTTTKKPGGGGPPVDPPSGDLKLAAYWGQNSAHHAQGTENDLFPDCKNWDHVMIAFLLPDVNSQTPWSINHAKHGGWSPGDGPMTKIGSDIQSCQAAGVKILVSIGGEIANYTPWESFDPAEHAELFFDKFIAGTDNPYGVRMDGVDLNIEHDHNGWLGPGWLKWSEKFRALMNAQGGELLLTSAPQAPEVRGFDTRAFIGLDTLENPDVLMNMYVQFYNNPGTPAFPGWIGGFENSYPLWCDHAKRANQHLYVGLPAMREGAGEGDHGTGFYLTPEEMVPHFNMMKTHTDCPFAGFMTWDAGLDVLNTEGGKTYLQRLRDTWNGGSSPPEGTSAPPATTAPPAPATTAPPAPATTVAAPVPTTTKASGGDPPAGETGEVKLVAYWGQNSAVHAGGSEPDLFPACKTWDHVLIAFMLPDSNAQTPWTVNNAKHGLWAPGGATLTKIGADIASCREAGVKILMSLGGEIANYTPWESWDPATHAELVYEQFINPGTANPYGTPFDGIDLNVEHNHNGWQEAGWVKWSEKFRQLIGEGDDLLLTSAPQAPEVRPIMGSAYIGLLTLENPGIIRNEYIQFYNNPGSPAYAGDIGFEATWEHWCQHCRDARQMLYLGLPATREGAGEGPHGGGFYMTPEQMIPHFEMMKTKTDCPFGGFMTWDAGLDLHNSKGGLSYLERLRETWKTGTAPPEEGGGDPPADGGDSPAGDGDCWAMEGYDWGKAECKKCPSPEGGMCEAFTWTACHPTYDECCSKEAGSGCSGTPPEGDNPPPAGDDTTAPAGNTPPGENNPPGGGSPPEIDGLKLTAYWGQNSAHHAQSTEPDLYPSCLNWNEVLIAFLLPDPNAQTPWSINNSKHGLWAPGGATLTKIGSDIASCQEKGVKILMAIGGEIANYTPWESWDPAAHAELVYEQFINPGTANPYGTPFDGIDLNIEHDSNGWGGAGWKAWSEKFRQLIGADDSHLLTSAPQAPEVDGIDKKAYIGLETLENPGIIRNLYIQFYNNPGSPAHPGWVGSFEVAYEAWCTHTKKANQRLFVGLPATREGAGDGLHGGGFYMSPEDMIPEFRMMKTKTDCPFGGFMTWDAGLDIVNTVGGKTYLQRLAEAWESV